MSFKLAAVIFCSFLFLGISFIFSLPDGRLHLVFCDVGQGDAVYIRGPKGSDIVIDGGPDNRVLNCLGEKMPFWDRTIELVVLSHPQADHLTGLIEIIKRYQVKKILDSSAKNNSKEYELWEKLINEKKINRIEAKEGEKILVDKQAGLSVLWPKSGKDTPDINSSSTVVSLSFGSFSSLFTGDLDGFSLSNLSGLSSLGNLTILKIPHHGSKTGLSQKFLEVFKPSLAIISVGKNSFGHPSPETLKLLNDLNIKYLRTDKDKSIEIISDGKTWKINK
ncbi:MAG: MBL fold metallo-hydrolase [Patescibacteria group bacterium]|nr:MBL fold metallo-hydrolase [Patescibacteria group bacterium]